MAPKPGYLIRTPITIVARALYPCAAPGSERRLLSVGRVLRVGACGVRRRRAFKMRDASTVNSGAAKQLYVRKRVDGG
jgi:hypothetical protein